MEVWKMRKAEVRGQKIRSWEDRKMGKAEVGSQRSEIVNHHL
ncbi:MAG: hypothetical protein P8X47_07895 [Ignavibacteriaceae bacterium]